MSKSIPISVVCCQANAQKHTHIVSKEMDESVLTENLISQTVQELQTGKANDLHLAALHEEYGKVTYLQHVTQGGFFVYVGDPENLTEHWFGEGQYVAFIDSEGTGHASRVGPDGCTRTFRLLKGHLSVQ